VVAIAGALTGSTVVARTSDAMVARTSAEAVTRHEPCPALNAERKKAGLKPLLHDRELAKVAKHHAEDMAERGYFSHDSPEGEKMADRLKDSGIDYDYAGENIARGQADCEEVVADWMDSPGHRANILDRHFRHYGIGIKDRHYVVDFTD
jgi:uncharacterized protein YkwD